MKGGARSDIIWAKLDPGFFSNRKVLRAGRNGREVFLFALCINAQRGAHGRIPAADLEPWYVADQLRITEADAVDGVTKAGNAGLLVQDGDEVVIVGWGGDWARRPMSRAEIQKAYRARQAGRDDGAVTSDHQGNELPIREIREIRERETRNAPGSLSGSDSGQDDPGPDPAEHSGSSRPRRSARATSAADVAAQQAVGPAWDPTTSAAAALAASLGLDYAHELAQFRLNAASKGHTYANPDAAFEKFLRGSRDAGKPRAVRKAGATTSTPKPIRIRTELGTWVEEGPDGEMRPVDGP